MKYNLLAVVIPMKWLPQDTEQAVSAHPSDYALCTVTLEAMEEKNEA